MAGNSKVPDFMPIDDPALLDPLQEWGMNVIRLLFTWEAYEPTPGEYNQEYLDYYSRVIDWAAQRGIYIIVDIHQDSFSRFSNNGCGEGFPEWAIGPDIPHDTPDGTEEGCKNWGVTMIFDLKMHLTWHHFWRDTYCARTAYLDMIESIAARFSDKPNVIGIDLMNEPWGIANEEILPLYEDAEVLVRSHSPTWIIFVSTHALTSAGMPTYMEKPSFNNFAYSPHFYDPLTFAFNIYLGWSLDAPFIMLKDKAIEWNAPLFLGEFGATGTCLAGLSYVDEVYKELDKVFASGVQWSYTPDWTPEFKDGWNGEDMSIIDDAGEIRSNFRVRPFARRISGEPINIKVTHKSLLSINSIELEWNHDPALGETEIFAPQNILFPDNSYVIEQWGDSMYCGYDETGALVHCSSETPGRKRVKVRECVKFFGFCL